MTNTSAISISATYLNYSDLPNAYLTKKNDGKYDSERILFDLFITEAYNKHGVSLTYYVITFDTNYNKIFGEDNDRRLVRSFPVMGFYQLPKEEKLWTKFGIEGMDQFSIFVSKRHFDVASQYEETQTTKQFSPYIPCIGDVINANYNNYFYEIVDIKEENGMYLMSKQHIWELIVKPMRLGKFSTSASPSPILSADDNHYGLNF